DRPHDPVAIIGIHDVQNVFAPAAIGLFNQLGDRSPTVASELRGGVEISVFVHRQRLGVGAVRAVEAMNDFFGIAAFRRGQFKYRAAAVFASNGSNAIQAARMVQDQAADGESSPRAADSVLKLVQNGFNPYAL